MGVLRLGMLGLGVLGLGLGRYVNWLWICGGCVVGVQIGCRRTRMYRYTLRFCRCECSLSLVMWKSTRCVPRYDGEDCDGT